MGSDQPLLLSLQLLHSCLSVRQLQVALLQALVLNFHLRPPKNYSTHSSYHENKDLNLEAHAICTARPPWKQ